MIALALVAGTAAAQERVYKCGESTYTILPQPGCVDLETGEVYREQATEPQTVPPAPATAPPAADLAGSREHLWARAKVLLEETYGAANACKRDIRFANLAGDVAEQWRRAGPACIALDAVAKDAYLKYTAIIKHINDNNAGWLDRQPDARRALRLMDDINATLAFAGEWMRRFKERSGR